MSSKLRNFIKGIIVIIVFASAVILTNRVLILKSEDGYDQMQSYYKQVDNTVDVLFLGSSKIYCQIDTGVIWDEYGISSFDLGSAEAPSWNSYYYLKEALKTQTPKVIIYDASIAGFRQDVLFQPEVWAMTNNYGMKWNKNRIEQLKINTVNDKQFKKLLFPLNSMHSRYKELTKNDFSDENNTINYKGFDHRNTVIQFDTPDMSSVTEAYPCDEKHEKYIRLMIELAKEKNIPFVVIISPYVVTAEQQVYFNYIEQICNEENVTYIDFNKMYDELELNFMYDMAEDIHVNLSGSQKLSSYIGKYVKDNYDVTDHRGDARYSSWDEDATINRQTRFSYDLNNVVKEEKFEKLLTNEHYVVFKIDEMANLSVMNSGNEIIHAEGGGEYDGIYDDGEFRAVIHLENETTTLGFEDTKMEIGFPWNRTIVYDKVLKKVVYDRSYTE